LSTLSLTVCSSLAHRNTHAHTHTHTHTHTHRHTHTHTHTHTHPHTHTHTQKLLHATLKAPAYGQGRTGQGREGERGWSGGLHNSCWPGLLENSMTSRSLASELLPM